MSQSLDVFLAIAKAGYPVTAAYVRTKVRSKTIAQTLGHMCNSGYIKKQVTVEKKVVYIAIESPSRIKMEDIYEIAKARR